MARAVNPENAPGVITASDIWYSNLRGLVRVRKAALSYLAYIIVNIGMLLKLPS